MPSKQGFEGGLHRQKVESAVVVAFETTGYYTRVTTTTIMVAN